MSNIVHTKFAQLAKRPFKRGLKEIYLPSFVLTFIRTPDLPPTFASFLVPLNLNKLDMRDYLFHAYNIRVFSIRSFIKYDKVQRHQWTEGIFRSPRGYYRPKGTKKMTVEMDKPFIWPEAPTDLEPWSHEIGRLQAEFMENHTQTFTRESLQTPNAERSTLREQAKALLEGKNRRMTIPASYSEEVPVA